MELKTKLIRNVGQGNGYKFPYYTFEEDKGDSTKKLTSNSKVTGMLNTFPPIIDDRLEIGDPWAQKALNRLEAENPNKTDNFSIFGNSLNKADLNVKLIQEGKDGLKKAKTLFKKLQKEAFNDGSLAEDLMTDYFLGENSIGKDLDKKLKQTERGRKLSEELIKGMKELLGNTKLTESNFQVPFWDSQAQTYHIVDTIWENEDGELILVDQKAGAVVQGEKLDLYYLTLLGLTIHAVKEQLGRYPNKVYLVSAEEHVEVDKDFKVKVIYKYKNIDLVERLKKKRNKVTLKDLREKYLKLRKYYQMGKELGLVT